MLRLERLYEGSGTDADPGREDGGADPWDALLDGWPAGSGDGERTGWERLATDSGELQGFVEWLLDPDAERGDVDEVAGVDLLRAVCSRVGAAATRLGEDRLGMVATVVAGFYHELDREVWLDLLTDRVPLGDATRGAGPEPGPGDTRGARGDLGPWLASALGPARVGDLFAYAFETRRTDSPRIFRLLEGVLERRGERQRTVRAIRDAVERQAGGGPDTFSELWPELDDALRGEDPDELGLDPFDYL